MDIITIEKTELIALIDAAVTKAVERVLMPASDEPLTFDEIARYLKRSRATISRLKKRGLPHRNNRFRRSEVDDWLLRHGKTMNGGL